MASVGLRDFPVEDSKDESLGLGHYADALYDFVHKCQTPLTIALQGDWGSGKTSLMNLIRSRLAESNNYVLIWFNTWQYSQFGLQDELPLSLINHFLEQLDAPQKDLALVSRIGTRLRRWGTAAASMAAVVGEAIEGAPGMALKVPIGLMASKTETNPAQDVAKLKQQAEEDVKLKLAADGKQRIIVFIDDLDRLSPVKAVELLEAFKLFLEIPDCVYILACDYQVVSQGLKMKFGLSAQELKGKNFFDKIIQLPFQMPVTQYTVDNYIKKLLQDIGVEYAEDDIPHYRELIENSIGFNPRNLKRAFNCLLLLNIVAEKEGVFASQKAMAKKNEIQKVIFASVCLQRAYEEFYTYMVRNADQIDDEWFNRLKNEASYQDGGEIEDRLKCLQQSDASVTAARLASFMRSFYKAIQLSSDNDGNRLSESEVRNLHSLLTFAGVTASNECTSPEAAGTELDWGLRRRNRRIATALVAKCNASHQALLALVNAKSFATYQAHRESAVAVYVYHGGQQLPILGRQFGLNFDGGSYKVFIGEANETLLRNEKIPERLSELLRPEYPQNVESVFVEQGWLYPLEGAMPSDLSEEEAVEFLGKVAQEYFNALVRLQSSGS